MPTDAAHSDAPGETSPFLALARRGRTAWWTWPACLILALTLAFLSTVALAVPLALAHVDTAGLAGELQSAAHPATFFPATAMLFGIFLLGFAVAIRLVHGKRFGDIAGAWRPGDVARGALVWITVSIMLTFIDLALAPKGFGLGNRTGLLTVVLFALPALCVQTFAEEFVFRGYLTQALLLAVKRPWPAAVLSGAMFGALHIPNGAPQALSAVIFGIILARLAIQRGGVWFGFGLHLANNLFGAVAVVSAGDVFKGAPGLFTQATPQLMWWDVIASSVALGLVAAWAGRSSAR